MTAPIKKAADTNNSPGKPEGGPAVLHPTHQNIAYVPLLNQNKAAASKKEEEPNQDELDQ